MFPFGSIELFNLQQGIVKVANKSSMSQIRFASPIHDRNFFLQGYVKHDKSIESVKYLLLLYEWLAF